MPLQQVILPPEVKLESPPLTPPREQEVCLSPVTTITMTSQAAVPLTQTITSVPLQVLFSKHSYGNFKITCFR